MKSILVLVSLFFFVVAQVNAQDGSNSNKKKNQTTTTQKGEMKTQTDRTPGKPSTSEIKPETKTLVESGTQGNTETVEGKSGTQGQTTQGETSIVSDSIAQGASSQAQSGNKVRNESGVQTNTGTIQGKSGTQGQTTQGETSEALTNTPQSETSTAPSAQQTQYRSDDRGKILPDQIPSVLRETLRDERYKGWEKATWYYNQITNQYFLETKNGAVKKVYHFNGRGELIWENVD